MSSLNPTEKTKCLQDLRKPLVTVKCNAEIHTSFARAQHYPQWVKVLCPEIMISEIFWDLHCQAKMKVGLLHNLSYHMSAKCQAITVHYSVGVWCTQTWAISQPEQQTALLSCTTTVTFE